MKRSSGTKSHQGIETSFKKGWQEQQVCLKEQPQELWMKQRKDIPGTIHNVRKCVANMEKLNKRIGRNIHNKFKKGLYWQFTSCLYSLKTATIFKVGVKFWGKSWRTLTFNGRKLRQLNRTLLSEYLGHPDYSYMGEGGTDRPGIQKTKGELRGIATQLTAPATELD